MKKLGLMRKFLVVMFALIMTACGGNKAVKKPMEEKAPIKAGEIKKSGGYYKDDGPGDDIPIDLDSVPDAIPRHEAYAKRANQPYIALEKRYVPMTRYTPYKKQGMASWYGKRYHGGKTSTGEIYDMYGMTAAHKTLPIPSYARVTNLKNGNSVVVRINDRGPFINGRIIDLSYVAAHKLNMIEAGQTQVEVEAIDTRSETIKEEAQSDEAQINEVETSAEKDTTPAVSIVDPITQSSVNTESATKGGFFVQLGAFKSQQNSAKLIGRLADFNAGDSAKVFQESVGEIYRVKVGPYATKDAAQMAAAKLEKQYSLKGIVHEN